MTLAPSLLRGGIKVVDLSADYRLKDRAIYEAYYKETHTSPELLEEAVYGLPEIYREDIRGARLVANAGCYPASAILPLYPLLKEGLIEAGSIVVDSKSGVSGAGRSVNLAFMFSEVNESMKAYGIGTHRHAPEIEQEYSRAAGHQVSITFVPHLIPITRGILTTAYGNLTEGVNTAGCLEVLNSYYGEEPFVKVCKEGVYPEVRNVRHSNGCQIGARVDERGGRVVVVSAIDNLGKGASWNAVQNMNIMCGLPETSGIGGAGAFI
jgi:N-acetyl-gamma-glutamyl-phosphate reductase